MIGRAGARRLAALLVIGDAMLGGALVAVIVRSPTQTELPARAVTATTVAPPADAPLPAFDADVATDDLSAPSSAPPTAPTTTPTTTAPPSTSPTSAPPSTVASQATVPTTVATTLPATTLPPPPPPPPPPATEALPEPAPDS